MRANPGPERTSSPEHSRTVVLLRSPLVVECGDRPVTQRHQIPSFSGRDPRFKIAGAVEELMFECEIVEQCFIEWLGLVDDRFHFPSSPDQNGPTSSGTPSRSRIVASSNSALSRPFCAFSVSSRRTASILAWATQVSATCIRYGLNREECAVE